MNFKLMVVLPNVSKMLQKLVLRKTLTDTFAT